jgi:hypothetical protein
LPLLVMVRSIVHHRSPLHSGDALGLVPLR